MSKYLIPTSSQYIGNCYPPSSAQPGEVWYDSGEQCLKVYDGMSWHSLTGAHQQTLNWEAEQAIDQFIDLVDTKSHITELAAKYPLVEDALFQLEVAIKLCQNLEDNANT